MINIFSNRELSVLLWAGLLFIYVCRAKSVRISIIDVIKAFFAKKVILVFLLTIVVISIICWMLAKVNLWDYSLLKDTIIYSAFTISTIVKVVDDRINYKFSQIVTEHISVMAVLVTIVDFYSFNLIIELILVPILIYLYTLEFYSRNSDENKEANFIFKCFIKSIYICLFIVSLYKIIEAPNSFFSKNFVYSLMLPIILSCLLIPYYYLLCLYSVYEVCFLIIKVNSQGDTMYYKSVRSSTIRSCRFNLKKWKLIKNSLLESAGE